MKNKKDVQKEISTIENTPQVEINEMKPAAWRSTKKKLELLRTMVKYLDTNPTEAFVESEIKRLEKTVSSKMKEFDVSHYEEAGMAKKEITKLKKAHEAMYGLGKLRTQVRNLRVLLK